MMTDPVADLLTKVRNAVKAGHEKVEVPASKLKANICRVLKEEGYIKSFKIVAKSESDIKIKISLKEGAIRGLKRVSRPGLRIYKGYDEIPKIINGLGISILSTSKGVLSSRKTKQMKLGGELICNVW